MAFAVNEPLPGLETDAYADLEVAVRFASDSKEGALPGERTVTGPAGLSGVIDPASLSCWLPDSYSDPEDRAWQLRQMAPIFSNVLNRLVLHAGAVDATRGIVGLVGESGVGKSTIVRRLTDRNHRFAADDLLPVRFRPDPSAPVGRRLRPLVALAFLERVSAHTPLAVPLDPGDAIRRLIDNGFGEHGDPKTWAFQFDAYHRLVEAVPHFLVAVPDDRAAIDATADTITRIAGFVE